MSQQTRIKESQAFTTFDSTGNPTIEVQILLMDGTLGRGAAPRGSTIGSFECMQKYDETLHHGLRDVHDLCQRYNDELSRRLRGVDVAHLFAVDRILLELDKTENKENLGGNLTLAASIAALNAASMALKTPVYQLINPQVKHYPRLMFNVLDGTKESRIPGIECLLVENERDSVLETLKKASFVQRKLEDLIVEQGDLRAYGNQGSCVMSGCHSPKDMLEMTKRAVESAGYSLGKAFTLGLDLSTSDAYQPEYQTYHFAWSKPLKSHQLEPIYSSWIEAYQITYLEDLYSDNDNAAWEASSLKEKVLVAGDDLYATNPKRIKQYGHLANATVIKPNQIGTVMETIESIKIAKEVHHQVILSQRTSEIESNILTHIAYAGEADYIKSGGMRRLDRVSKYNELLRIMVHEAERGRIVG